jgi:hypothetical protein
MKCPVQTQQASVPLDLLPKSDMGLEVKTPGSSPGDFPGELKSSVT